MPTKPKRFANGQPVLPCQLLPQTSPCFLPMKDDWVWVGRANPCACRKPKSGRIGDAARQPGRATRCVRSAEPGERPEHPGPRTGAFSQYCTTRLENAHNTEFRELLYPWHPWSGLRIGIHEAIE